MERLPEINLDEYDYDLHYERIAQHPVEQRDMSKLLVYKGGKIYKEVFRNIGDILPLDSLLVFNNTRVIRARILFRKDTGADIEVLCLEPADPSEYELSFGSTEPVEWKCIIGNLKKWKKGPLINTFIYNGTEYSLIAEKKGTEGEAWRIRFKWNCPGISFSEVIEKVGHIPLPPYINREDEPGDIDRYQTVYSRINGSVAAPTAGLHFTDALISELRGIGLKLSEITLHVGAGTFKPVKSKQITEHTMHCEHFFVTSETIELLLHHHDKVIAVGTTSVRTLESLYWLGVKARHYPESLSSEPFLAQWESYGMNADLSVKESLEALLNILADNNKSYLQASTSMMIIPGYNFRMINGMITNFHQPGSTLLLLISAWVGKEWANIYKFALDNEFRFLSYGDCSLLLK